jgi:para-nitrobenzyl esterase
VTLLRQLGLLQAVCLLGALSVPASGASAAPGQPVVTIPQGQLAGSFAGPLEVFKGVPYALPPTGNLRWRPPAAPASWRGIRQATTFGPSCMQPALLAGNLYADPPAAMSEDCLTLNVWAPQAAHGAPVIVWIHGGALAIGGSSEQMYDGANFARRGVVFVSINYRLGIFGWLALPALSTESRHRASGDYGLLDQIAALQWVHANISAFGGDPANVTIMGESAGALSVTYLLTSPLSRGLFQKAIAESANIRAVPELRQAAHGLPAAEQIGSKFATIAGAPTLASLRAMTPGALLQAAARAHFWTQATIDGWVLPEQVVDAFDRGHAARVPLLAGFNSGEIRSQRALLPAAPADAIAYTQRIERGYGDLAPVFLRLYPAADIPESMLATVRDAVYGWATERLVRQESAAGAPSYLYFFDHCYPAARARKLCGFHASELPFVFGQIGQDAHLPPNWPRPLRAQDRALSAAMMADWVGFARTGIPAGAGQPVWRPYSAAQSYMDFADTPRPGHHLLPGMFAMQEQLVERRRKAGLRWFTNVGVAAPPLAGKPSGAHDVLPAGH